MEKEFIPYELALELKELGFDEPCLAFYDGKETNQVYYNSIRNGSGDYEPFKDNERLKWFGAPLYQQAFRWLRHKHNCVCEIIRKEDGNHSEFIGWVYIDGRKIDVVSYWDSKSYEETELECLKKLIEIIKNNGK